MFRRYNARADSNRRLIVLTPLINARRTSDSNALFSRSLSHIPFASPRASLATASAHDASYAAAHARVNRSSSPARVLHRRIASLIPRHASNVSRRTRRSHTSRTARSSLAASTARRHRPTARLAASLRARRPNASTHRAVCVLDLVHISRHRASRASASRRRARSSDSARLDSVSTARAHAVVASTTRRSSARNVARIVSSRIAPSSASARLDDDISGSKRTHRIRLVRRRRRGGWTATARRRNDGSNSSRSVVDDRPGMG